MSVSSGAATYGPITSVDELLDSGVAHTVSPPRTVSSVTHGNVFLFTRGRGHAPSVPFTRGSSGFAYSVLGYTYNVPGSAGLPAEWSSALNVATLQLAREFSTRFYGQSLYFSTSLSGQTVSSSGPSVHYGFSPCSSHGTVGSSSLLRQYFYVGRCGVSDHSSARYFLHKS